MKRYLILSIAFVAYCGACIASVNAQADPPKLVVVIVVDQMRYDFFERFGDKFDGGLKRIWDQGVVYSNAHHNHAPTNTAPGHATIATGKYPGKNGIINNSLYSRETGEEMSPVGDDRSKIIGVENDGELPERSPVNLKSTSIGDWIKKDNSESKVYSVARKDRAAILLGGKKPDRAFWIDNLSTRLVSSTYYGKNYPDWASSFIGKELMRKEMEEGWNKKLPEEAYAHLRPDDFLQEKGLFYPDFPHNKNRMRTGLPEVNKDLLMLTSTPFGEKFIMDFARAIILNEKLGSRSATDMLLISCSMADAIGHHFGPESHEIMDYYLYLDEYLGEFLEFIDDQLGKDNYWVVLSSDHGVQPMPEGLALKGKPARRILISDIMGVLDSIENRVMEKFKLPDIVVEFVLGGLFINYAEADAMGVKRRRIRAALAEEILGLDFVADVFTIEDLASKVDRDYIDSYRRSYVRGLSPDIMVRFNENILVHGPTGTGHGSVYPYDTHVPIIFNVPGIPHVVIDRKVSTVDIAPTIASMLGINADKKVDGEVLHELISSSSH